MANLQAVNGAGLGPVVTSVNGETGDVEVTGSGGVDSVDGQTGDVELDGTYLALAGGTLAGALTGTTATMATVTATTTVKAGASNWASTGEIRLPSGGAINARNAANNADLGLISANASDQLQLGRDTVPSSDSAVNLGSSALRWATIFGVIGSFGSTTPSTSGAVRLNNADTIGWRNAANSSNIAGITVNSSDQVALGAAVVPDGDNTRTLGTSAARWSTMIAVSAQLGTTPAATGALRIASTGQINWRNAANSGDIGGFSSNASDQLQASTTLVPSSDSAKDLGSSTLRWANIYGVIGVLGSATNVASAGALRMANTTAVNWRNAANSADLGWTVNGSNQMVTTAELVVPDLAPASTTGATVAFRYFRGTTTGAPTTGTWVAGDKVPDLAGNSWTCTVGGTPGTWVQDGSGTYQTIALAATKAATNEVVDAKGDLLVGSAADTLARLAVGTNGKVPVANSNSSTGLIYANVAPSLARVGGYTRAGGTSANNTQTANRLYFSPILLSRRITWDRIAVNHAATTAGAGSVIRLGVYNNATTGYDFPDALAFDAGTVAADTAAAFKTITISQALDPGLYWLAVVVQWVTTAPSMAAYVVQAMESPVSDPATITANSGFYYQDTVTGTLPGTATPSANMSLNCPVVWLRAS